MVKKSTGQICIYIVYFYLIKSDMFMRCQLYFIAVFILGYHSPQLLHFYLEQLRQLTRLHKETSLVSA